jgi:hypothetical protein
VERSWHSAAACLKARGIEVFPGGKIGLVGFEPTASTSRTWRSSQAEPQPVKKKRRLDRPKGEVNLGFPRTCIWAALTGHNTPINQSRLTSHSEALSAAWYAS